MRRVSAAVALAAALAPAAWAAVPSSGIAGRATLSPVCPVERYPPDPACAPRGFRALVRVVRRSDGRTVARVKTGSDGRFRIPLRAARYRVSARAADGGSLPRCPSQAVTVRRGRYASVRFDCDSGIR